MSVKNPMAEKPANPGVLEDLSWDEDAPPREACYRCFGRCCDPFEPDEPCLRCGGKGIEPADHQAP